MSWQRLGDRAIRFPRPAAPARATVREVRTWPGVVDVVVAAEDVAAYFVDEPRLALDDRIALLASVSDTDEPVREHELRVRYDGMDLDEIAIAQGLTRDEVIAMHSAATYTVETIGFAPGFGYLSGLDPRLELPRRATPRTSVPAQSVAIAGLQSAVYPFASPGGWHVLGRVTNARMFEWPLHRSDARGPLLGLGDRVRFVRDDSEPLRVVRDEAPGDASRSSRPAQFTHDARPSPSHFMMFAEGPAVLEFARVSAVCTVQDLGRRGHMHEAVPPGGALVPEWLVAANRRARNGDSAPAIEVSGRLTVRAHTEILVATDRETTRLRAGDEYLVDSEERPVTYLAIRGGIDAPYFLDGYGTLICAGGFPLGRGATVRSADLPPRADDAPPPILSESDTIDVIAGPDLDAFASDALDQLQAASYRISRYSNRVGARIEGPSLARIATYRGRSRPMVVGALEVPGDGVPIVLGPEHPTTGGYPILAVIATADLGRFFAIRIGGTVRFRVAR